MDRQMNRGNKFPKLSNQKFLIFLMLENKTDLSLDYQMHVKGTGNLVFAKN